MADRKEPLQRTTDKDAGFAWEMGSWIQELLGCVNPGLEGGYSWTVGT